MIYVRKSLRNLNYNVVNVPESRRPCFSATLIGLRGWSQDLDLAGNLPPAPVRTNSESCVGSNPTVDISFFFACSRRTRNPRTPARNARAPRFRRSGRIFPPAPGGLRGGPTRRQSAESHPEIETKPRIRPVPRHSILPIRSFLTLSEVVIAHFAGMNASDWTFRRP